MVGLLFYSFRLVAARPLGRNPEDHAVAGLGWAGLGWAWILSASQVLARLCTFAVLHAPLPGFALWFGSRIIRRGPDLSLVSSGEQAVMAEATNIALSSLVVMDFLAIFMPAVWFGILALFLLLYGILDGFVLGVGILPLTSTTET